MKKCLLLFWHGIGDLITFTPALRELNKHGYHTDILVRRFVVDSGVFKACPYADLIPMDITPVSAGGPEGAKAKQRALAELEARKDAYDASYVCNPNCWKVRGALAALYYEETVKAFSLTPTVDLRNPTAVYGPPEIWIPERCEQEAARFVEENYPNGFIFKSTMPEKHPAHCWKDAAKWIKRELPPLPVFDSDAHGKWGNINTLFAIAKKAQHRVLSSSFMVHACEAMGVTMDVVNYGVEASKHWPEDPNMIRIIRRKESKTAKYSYNGGRTWVTGI